MLGDGNWKYLGPRFGIHGGGARTSENEQGAVAPRATASPAVLDTQLLDHRGGKMGSPWGTLSVDEVLKQVAPVGYASWSRPLPVDVSSLYGR